MPPQLLPDVQATVTSYLATNAAMRAELPAHPLDAATANVGAEVQAPYPCVRIVATPSGSDRQLRHTVAQELLVEVWGDEVQDGTSSPAELRRLLYVALRELAALAEADDHVVDGVAVTHVTSSQPGTYLPDPTGQPRYLAGVTITAHPA